MTKPGKRTTNPAAGVKKANLVKSIKPKDELTKIDGTIRAAFENHGAIMTLPFEELAKCSAGALSLLQGIGR
ncbi:MAG TPA: hypothetical protein VIN60_05890 [Anaerolineales bacterium]